MPVSEPERTAAVMSAPGATKAKPVRRQLVSHARGPEDESPRTLGCKRPRNCIVTPEHDP